MLVSRFLTLPYRAANYNYLLVISVIIADSVRNCAALKFIRYLFLR